MDKKKKVLVVLNTMGHGGVAKSLLNFINNMKDKVQLDLFLFRDDGEIMNELPKDINVIISKGYMGTFIDNRKKCKKLGFKRYLFKCLMNLNVRFFHSNKRFVKYALKLSEKLSGYDVAISYNGVAPDGCPWVGSAEFVLNNVEATLKYAITHDDYMPENYKRHSIELYKKFDKVLAVSESCKNRIVEHVPELKDKFDFCYNFCNVEEILLKKDKPVETLKEQDTKIITVARLSKEKGVERTLPALKKLKEQGYKFVYYIIGSGVSQQAIELYINDNNLNDNVKLLGYKNNPFGYVKQADLFLLPSYRESYGLVLVESMLLGVPVLSTNTVSASEVVGDYGYICDNTDEGIFESLKNLLRNKRLIEEKKKELKNYNYQNDKIRDKWLDLFNKN